MEIVFTVNRNEYKINPSTVPIETSLNTFLRSHLRLTGTKFMCLEGGCGACVVTISGIKTPTGETQTFAVNSCLWPVYSCDGLNVTTVEGIGNFTDGYHVIQKVLWHFNGTQCGYCSPGMVMNMYSLLETNNGKVTMDQVENSFGGNTCRCTGYRPILDAFKSLASDSCIDIDIEDLTLDVCKLKDINGSSPCTNQCSKKCSLRPTTIELMDDDEKVWIKPANATELFKALMTKTMNTEYMLVAGNTAHGVYRRSRNIKVFIDVRNITELHVIIVNEKEMVFGGNVTLTDMMNALQMAAKKYNFFSYAEQIAKHIDLVANVPVRSAGSIAGNLSIKHAYREFPSDIFLILEAIGAQMNIANSIDGTCRTHSLKDYLALDMRQKLIVNVILPKLPPDQFLFRSYKVMPRSQNAHAMINAAFLFEFDKEMAVKSCRICYGGVSPSFIHAEGTEKLLTGVKDLFTNEILQNVIKSLKNEIQPDSVLPDPSPEYRQSLAIGLFYRFLLAHSPPQRIDDPFKSGAIGLERPLSSGSQAFESDEKLYPLTQAVPKYDGLIQCAGEAQYANDHFSSFRFDQELWAAFVPCTNVHSKMVSIDAGKALKLPGVHSFISAKNIPGINSFMPFNSNIFGITEREELFLSMDSEVLFHGQPCGMILAKTMDTALAAADLIEIGYEKLNSKEIVPCLSHWLECNENVPLAGSLTKIFPPTVDPSEPLVRIENQRKIEGDFEIGAQYHFTMENQTTFCYPNDDGGLDVYCATQCLDVTQVAIAKLLNIQQSRVNVFVKRLGAGYGGKLTACASPACGAALGAFLTRQPVRFVLTIESNMRTLGKRYACAFNYTMNIDSGTGHISNLNATLSEDYGYTLNDDVSFFTMDTFNRTCYARTDAWKITINKVKTDAPSSTWCRAPGALESVSFQETIMEQIGREINLDPAQVRLNNLPNDSTLKKYFPEFLKDTEYYERKSKINEFNKQNRWRKKGIAVSIMHYPIVYFGAFPTYVAIYHSDGTVAISHGGIEIGQGIHTKVAQVAAHTLGIPYNFITVTQSTTLLAPNNNLTGGSITSESVCAATKRACQKILERMKPVRDKMPNASWVELIQACFTSLIDLNETQTFTALEGKNYAVIGCACAEVEVDVLTGNTQIRRVDIVEDTGQSMSPLMDVGQIEGAFMMGVGYWLIERLDYNRQTGELLTNRSWNYRVPGAKDIPIDFRIKFLQNVNSDGILRSKTTGEPALCLAICVPFALRHAMDSIRADNGKTEKWFRMGSGNTPDVVVGSVGTNVDDFKLK